MAARRGSDSRKTPPTRRWAELLTCLHLSQGGYVRYQGIWDVCVQVPPEIYQALCVQFTP